MEGLAMATATRILIPSDTRVSEFAATTRRSRNVCVFGRNPRNFVVFAASDDDKLKLDKWDQMELKFGRLIGEDPQLTLAKIMGRKSDPNMSYLEVEKSFYKKKSESKGVEEVPLDGFDEKRQSGSLNGLNLVRPIPKKGVKFETENRPVKSRINLPNQVVRNPVKNKGSVPNVILRKPTTFSEDDIGLQGLPKMGIKPNLLVGMGKELTKEKFTDMTLLKKPKPMISNSNLETEPELFLEIKAEATNELTLLSPPKTVDFGLKFDKMQQPSDENKGSNSSYGLNMHLEAVDLSTDSIEMSNYIDPEEAENASSLEESGSNDFFAGGAQRIVKESAEKSCAALIGKPKRLDQTVKGTGTLGKQQSAAVNPNNYRNAAELEIVAASLPTKEFEESDWRRAEDLVKTSERDDVELISSSTRGFVASYGSLIGFLPYRNLSARWKFLAFESWLRKKGLDPAKYKRNLGVIGNNGILNATSLDPAEASGIDEKVNAEISADMELEDLLRIYESEKLKFLSSFVGQRIKVNVVLADRKSRRLIFSLKPKEKEEIVDKKRTLMAKLNVGDVVKCQIKKITYFGIFVELDGVTALVHQTEVSWDATLDPSSYYKVGQIVDAKVHQLDFSLGRIFLSLKEITPDPLHEALEAVIGDKNTLDARLEVALDDSQWAEVESLIKELQQFQGIESVTKGRFFLSPGLAPTFQVYMASMFENEYKLLARSGNKVQEVIVQTSLDKEEMKSAILTCTNRVE